MLALSLRLLYLSDKTVSKRIAEGVGRKVLILFTPTPYFHLR